MTTRRPGRVLLVVPDRAGDTTGNEVTVQRHVRLLRAGGVAVDVLRPGDDLSDASQHLAADLVHAYHARRCGPRARWLAGLLKVPLVVSITGTDLSLDLGDDRRRDTVTDVVSAAAAVLCGHDDEVAVVRSLAPGARFVGVVPKAVSVPDALPAPTLARDPHEIVVLAVANVRPVKRLDVALRAVAGLRAEECVARLVVVGSVIDTDENTRLAELCGGSAAWERVRHAPVAHDQMAGLYASADIVLNSSDAEGGSNAILEAMAHGRAVVASDVHGNAALVGRDATRGLLYPTSAAPDGTVSHDVTALAGILARLARDPVLRERLGAAAREHVRAHHSDDAEVEALLAAYAAASPSA